jgi:hypothetical protein
MTRPNPDPEMWYLLTDEQRLSYEDVYDQNDLISLDELEPYEQSQMERAGVDPMTPVDGFINMNGDTAFITETNL